MGDGIRVKVDCSDDDLHDEEVQHNKQNASDGGSSTHNSDSDKDDHMSNQTSSDDESRSKYSCKESNQPSSEEGFSPSP